MAAELLILSSCASADSVAVTAIDTATNAVVFGGGGGGGDDGDGGGQFCHRRHRCCR